MLPDSKGHFGQFGGRFIPETLMPAVVELAAAYQAARRDPRFRKDLDYYLREYAGRPTPLYVRRALHAALRRRDGLSSSARTCTTPARTRSTTRSARRCSPGAWARSGHRGDRRGPARRRHRRRRARSSGSSASSTWARRTSAARRSTCSGCALLGATRRAGRRRRAHAQGRDDRGDARLGRHRRQRPTTSSARVVGPASLSRRWCAISSA